MAACPKCNSRNMTTIPGQPKDGSSKRKECNHCGPMPEKRK